VERLFRSGQRRALATVHELDREWNRLLHWISEPKLNHDGRTDHRNGDFYSLIGREFYARGPEIKSARALSLVKSSRRDSTGRRARVLRWAHNCSHATFYLCHADAGSDERAWDHVATRRQGCNRDDTVGVCGRRFNVGTRGRMKIPTRSTTIAIRELLWLDSV
jgi:hypothetical protein